VAAPRLLTPPKKPETDLVRALFGGRFLGDPSLTRKFDESEPRDERGRWTADGSGWTDPGPMRAPGLPLDFASLSDAEQRAVFERNHAQDDAWTAAMNRGVAIGAITPDEATARGWDGPLGRPVQELPPVLYHATTALSSVLDEGLKTRDELGGKTALGGGPSDTISFTTDRVLAERIAETTLEAREVALGNITNEDLLHRAEDGGFATQMMSLLHGADAWDRFAVRGQMYDYGLTSTLVRGLDEQIARQGDLGWHPAPGATAFGPDGDRYAQWERPMTDAERDDYRFRDVYRAFLLSQEAAGGPSDPMFWSPDVQSFKELDPAEVGVVQATPKPGAMGYQTMGMSEWRTWSGDAVTVQALKAWRPDLAKMSVPQILRLRSLTTKYDESEPRDEAGRWTTGGGAPDPAAVEAGRKAWVGYWFDDDLNPRYVKDYHTEIRKALAGTLAAENPGWHPSGIAQYASKGEALLQAIARGEPTITPLYRGMAVSAEDAEAIKAFKPGDTVDLNLSSWTSDRDSAARFMAGQGGYTGRTGNNPVLFEMVGDKHALDVGPDTPLPKEKEWLSDGRFTVLSVETQPAKQYPYADTWTGPRQVNPDSTIVRLAQESVFTSAAETTGTKILKYSPDQPRDERGRWSSDGSSLAWTDVTSAIREQGMGNCYQAAVTMMLDAKELGLIKPKVIQATVVGQGPIAGVSYGHSWLEAENRDYPGLRIAYDYSSGKSVQLPASLYRQIGRVTNVHEYDDAQMRVAMLKAGHYGPWT
jgi:hypothetical protein